MRLVPGSDDDLTTQDGRRARMTPEQSRFYATLLDEMFDGVYFVDLDRRITYWNKGAERITGFSASEVTGRSCSENILVHVDGCGNQLCENGCPLTAAVRHNDVGVLDIFLHHRDGHRVPVAVRAAPMHDAEGRVVGAIEVFSDNSARMAALEKVHTLERAAYTDPLTGLPNRRLGESFLAARVDEQRREGWPYAVIMLDVDHFKQVNDTFGHDAGDEVLRMVAKSLGGGIRSVDLACRWGGEEFLVVLANPSPGELVNITGRLLSLVRSSSFVAGGGERLVVTVSAGATLARPGEFAADAIRRADEYLYQSKSNGRDRLTCDPESNWQDLRIAS
jgi:diguanylate cyclase (GGDEF)-like protein/PAS domain S-box-containing protein